jgi:uncharacterized protein (DUF2336 family)
MADMSQLQKQIPAMLSLAHERTEGARVELAGMLADVFLNVDAQLTLREQELLNELIEQLLQARTSAVRAHLVEKFADLSQMARMPRAMARGLSNDTNIEIARKVLTTSSTLMDEDLVAVIETQSPDHAQAIAQRSAISEAVADALVTTGDVRVMQMVAENLGAKLSIKAVDAMTDAARFAEALREPLLKRPEMTSDAATRLYWWVSQDLRRYALKRFGISSGQIDTALARTIDQMLDYHDLDKADDKTMIQVADWLNDRQAVSIRILPQVLRLGHFRLFNILLSRLANLSLSLIDSIVTETGGRGLAVVCRAIGIDKAGFVSIFLLSRGARPGEQIVHPRELSYALAAFDRLSVGLAQDLLHNWKQDPSYFVNKKQDDVMLEG